MVHIHTIYTGFTHFCREISLVAITGQIWWEEAQTHFIGPGSWGPGPSNGDPLGSSAFQSMTKLI